MRIAVKYAMDDVQVAIVQVAIARVTQKPPDGEAIARLAFIAEFPSHIYQNVAIQVFTDACSIDFSPTADDLKPLMAFPPFVARLMQYREAHSNPDRSRPNMATYLTVRGRDGRVENRLVAKEWLDTQFESFGFKPLRLGRLDSTVDVVMMSWLVYG